MKHNGIIGITMCMMLIMTACGGNGATTETTASTTEPETSVETSVEASITEASAEIEATEAEEATTNNEETSDSTSLEDEVEVEILTEPVVAGQVTEEAVEVAEAVNASNLLPNGEEKVVIDVYGEPTDIEPEYGVQLDCGVEAEVTNVEYMMQYKLATFADSRDIRDKMSNFADYDYTQGLIGIEGTVTLVGAYSSTNGDNAYAIAEDNGYLKVYTSERTDSFELVGTYPANKAIYGVQVTEDGFKLYINTTDGTTEYSYPDVTGVQVNFSLTDVCEKCVVFGGSATGNEYNDKLFDSGDYTLVQLYSDDKFEVYGMGNNYVVKVDNSYFYKVSSEAFTDFATVSIENGEFKVITATTFERNGDSLKVNGTSFNFEISLDNGNVTIR